MKFIPLRDFPSELLIPSNGTISSKNGFFSITIKLEPFDLDNEKIAETLMIDDLSIPAKKIENLAGKEFNFPVNPEAGYVETSIYIWSVHNPIDVIKIKFAKVNNGNIDASFDMKFAFEFEGCCKNLNKTITVPLRLI